MKAMTKKIDGKVYKVLSAVQTTRIPLYADSERLARYAQKPGLILSRQLSLSGETVLYLKVGAGKPQMFYTLPTYSGTMVITTDNAKYEVTK